MGNKSLPARIFLEKSKPTCAHVPGVIMRSVLFADVVVVIHLAFVLFVLVGQILILLGALLRWQWVRNLWFRVIHLLSIAIVAGQAIAGITCPLTTLEDKLRAGVALEKASWLGRTAHQVLFYQAPDAVFLWCYIAFAVLVLFTFVVAPPRVRKQPRSLAVS
jgi:hypothetical protein